MLVEIVNGHNGKVLVNGGLSKIVERLQKFMVTRAKINEGRNAADKPISLRKVQRILTAIQAVAYHCMHAAHELIEAIIAATGVHEFRNGWGDFRTTTQATIKYQRG